MLSWEVSEEQTLSSCPKQDTCGSRQEAAPVKGLGLRALSGCLFIQQQEHRTASVLIQPLPSSPKCLWVRGLCDRTAEHFAGDTLFPSPFPHPPSESWDLGGLPAAQGVMASSPQPSLFLASLFLLPLIPFSQRPLEARPDVQPGLPQAAANISHTLEAPAGANSWFSSCPGAPGYPCAKSSTKSCKGPPQDQLGKEVAPHLPDMTHPKTKSPSSSPKNKIPLPKTFPKGSI